MRARAFRREILVVLSTLLLGVNCTELAGIEEAHLADPLRCAAPSECEAFVVEPACRQVLGCVEGLCKFEDAPEGTRLDGQTVGDCRAIVCDGAGRSKIELDSGDPANDGNPCTDDACEGFVTTHIDLVSALCYTAPHETLGIGRCAAGVQECQGGQPVGPCLGERVPVVESCESPEDDDCDGATNESGVGCVCVPGEVVPCYSGPPETLGVGPCHAGQKTCEPSGLGYGPCEGERAPSKEVCEPAGMDEDCNGLEDDAFECHCGNGVLDPGEICDDGNGLPFDGCTNACQLAKCGDGVVANGEICDDGNEVDGDACPSTCVSPPVKRVSLGAVFGCALLAGQGVKCWGSNLFGKLGRGTGFQDHVGDQPGEMNTLGPIDLGTDVPIVDVAAGTSHACVLFEDGAVKCWGQNYGGALGLGDEENRGDEPGEMGVNLPPVDLGPGRSVARVAVGMNVTCVVIVDGSLECWGNNNRGQLGLEDTDARGGHDEKELADKPPIVNLGVGVQVVDVTLGMYHGCALLRDGAIKCWGENRKGQLGLGDTVDRGDNPGEMGNHLGFVDLGEGRRAVDVEAGDEHTCALLDDGSVKCWGSNQYGRLGLGIEDTLHQGDQKTEMGNSLPSVGLGTGAKAVALAVGGGHTCVLLQDGRVKCWGRNECGQLGLGDAMPRGGDGSPMVEDLPAVDLGSGLRAISIWAGAMHTCALLENGSLKCWGQNSVSGVFPQAGALGLGHTEHWGDQGNEMGDGLLAVKLY
ncbi:DUF4215 domain-containing protein [Polyangium sp. y55x31]|uniref:RCC1 domain-containing protein n=1 Tax=Polyangium sp. y55x31 TaxID=3042688 RepID=UPI0024824E75|nr:DUF4215 domain-containing protein [Polyangium sp. y55x31]MDI1476821.1 DUF4215 domain-containing protein [Polyangium sp. y55x31]